MDSDAAAWWFLGVVWVLYLWSVVSHESYAAVFALFMP